MVAEGRAQWIRLPTHPTLTENLDVAAASSAHTMLGHSCERPLLERLARYMPQLRADVATGDCIEI
jgi:hypothetical protein